MYVATDWDHHFPVAKAALENGKHAAIERVRRQLGLTREEIAVFGDDLNDLPALTIAGLSAAPADAAEDVKQRVEYITPHKGGRGAVRDLLELILKARGIWDAIVEEYTEEGKEDRQ